MGAAIFAIVLVILGIVLFIRYLTAEIDKEAIQKSIRHTCPLCGSANTKLMDPLTRITDGGGYIATAGKSHICKRCGKTF